MKENKIEWLIKDHVILSTAYDWDIVNFEEHILEVKKLVDTSPLPLVHTIWDFSELEHYPNKLPAINKAVKPLFTHEQLGWVVTIIDNQIIAFLSQMATSLYRVRYRSYKNMEEAKAFLVSTDPVLESIP